MQKIVFHTKIKSNIADCITPIQIYSFLRNKAKKTLLLESSDYNSIENCFSYICFLPVARFSFMKNTVTIGLPDKTKQDIKVKDKKQVLGLLKEFSMRFKGDHTIKNHIICNGLFGYFGYEAVGCFEDIDLKNSSEVDIPSIEFSVYKYIIAIDHFHERVYSISHQYENEARSFSDTKYLSFVTHALQAKTRVSLPFYKLGEEKVNLSNDEYIELVKKGIQHCYRGDVYQLVLSRRFRQRYMGDAFQVYRVLRSINPSPYLFYFDFEKYSIFGSSPEAQLTVKNNKATLFPIAGTFAKTGNDAKDLELGEALSKNKKESAEHLMLVDLARNDLSKFGKNLCVEKFKETQYFAHVIHLVSKISVEIDEDKILELFASTFPAGTLSGAPKYRAMQLIDNYEREQRNYYGGSIGFIGFNLEINQAIMIRSFLAYKNTLHFQAGAGIVAGSLPEKELQEVTNKLVSLRKAIEEAQHIK